MKSLAEIFYDAIQADDDLMEAVGGRVESTCFETPDGDADNTELPNIIVVNQGFNNNNSTKDYVWEGPEDVVQAMVDVDAKTDGEVTKLVAQVRRAIENYILAMYNQGEEPPQLQPGYPSAGELTWDWMRPCYFQQITYQCTVSNGDNEEDE